jgi:hypothetical protein
MSKTVAVNIRSVVTRNAISAMAMCKSGFLLHLPAGVMLCLNGRQEINDE